MDFTKTIIAWYTKNKRDLPWRNITNPYFIWLSEIILQQTRVEQGMSYYLNFTKEFPTINKLANASEEEVIKLWQGLGYYSRARNLHATAKHISSTLKGKFPTNYNDLLQLKGIGPYTAAAISSFAFNLPHAVVDGNVYRLLACVFGVKTLIDSTQGKKEFQELANELLDKKQPSTFNQAMMEFGAIKCKPHNPDCSTCVLNSICIAYSKKMVAKLPVKEKTTKVRNRYFNYIVLKHKNKIVIKKRVDNDIWKNLYDFPLIETTKELRELELLKTVEWKKVIGNSAYTIHAVSKTYKHVLSHQKIFARFWEVRTNTPITVNSNYLLINKKDFEKYPIPRLVDIFIND